MGAEASPAIIVTDQGPGGGLSLPPDSAKLYPEYSEYELLHGENLSGAANRPLSAPPKAHRSGMVCRKSIQNDPQSAPKVPKSCPQRGPVLSLPNVMLQAAVLTVLSRTQFQNRPKRWI